MLVNTFVNTCTCMNIFVNTFVNTFLMTFVNTLVYTLMNTFVNTVVNTFVKNISAWKWWKNNEKLIKNKFTRTAVVRNLSTTKMSLILIPKHYMHTFLCGFTVP